MSKFVMRSYRPITEVERKYTFAQSQQISMQTGLIGYLRADFGSSGKEFFSSWNDFNNNLKTDGFKEEFDGMINFLREDGKPLSNRTTLARNCYDTPVSSYGDARDHFGFRLNTEKYAYLMRFNPNRGDYNLYCYCFERDALDQHLKNAEKGIRFIDSNYNEQFRISDGDSITITTPDGTVMHRGCRYIDEYHVEIGDNCYHICQFAEMMERNGNKVEPVVKQCGDVDKLIENASGRVVDSKAQSDVVIDFDK